jgi:DNA (cytosine-5)-methyltransferase 1
MREIVVDSFAGGGGASTGIELALGRSPDIAINHDAEALRLHERNHPTTRHIRHDIWKVDPLTECGGRPVGLLWASPDCKHFSKAKGGVPREKGIRDLAWVVVRWAEQVRPRVIILENVEEFQTWGPLTADGQPCPEQKGATFRRWVGELERLGYRVEWRELRACDYGAPTIRKRLFLIARCDRRPIVWPEPTHGAPGSEAVAAGRLRPWRTAAEIIDWSLACPSIFLTREEARAIGANRPLADATMARIAKGMQRYVLEAAKPFVVPLTHHGAARIYPLGEPMRTVTGAKRGETALVAPHIVPICHTANAPTAHDIEAPVRTITTAKGGELSLVAAHLSAYYGEGAGSTDRSASVDEPARTITTENRHAVIAAHVQRQFGASVGSDAEEPIGTTTAGGGGKSAVVAAFLAQHNLGMVGHDVRDPVSTLTGKGCQQTVVEVSAGLVDLHGSDRRQRDIEDPAPTVTAGGTHQAEVRAFLTKYFGSAEHGQDCADPLHTVTAKPRFGLVTIEGMPYEIVDIGMRMLTPRELYRAQGFPDGYVIDEGADGRPLTKTAQVRMCGNSVSPPVAAALVAANYVQDQPSRAPTTRRSAAGVWRDFGTMFENAGVVL